MAGAGGHDHGYGLTPTRRQRVVVVARCLARWLLRRAGQRRAQQSDDVRALEAFNRGVRLGATGDRHGAISAYQASIAIGDDGAAALAAFNLAALWSDDLKAMTSAYLAAIDTEHPDVAPKAAYNLGSVLAADGDLDAATMMLQRALRYGHDDVSARAALKLENLRAEAFIHRLAARRSVTVPTARPRIAPRSASSRRRGEPARRSVDRSRRQHRSH
jgi:tetratricopeptide (TPR) repeat protein